MGVRARLVLRESLRVVAVLAPELAQGEELVLGRALAEEVRVLALEAEA